MDILENMVANGFLKKTNATPFYVTYKDSNDGEWIYDIDSRKLDHDGLRLSITRFDVVFRYYNGEIQTCTLCNSYDDADVEFVFFRIWD